MLSPPWSSVSVLTIRPNVRGFRTGRGRWNFKDGKIRNTTYFGVEVKSSVLCCRILQHVKESYEYGKGIRRQNSAAISFPIFSCFAKRCLCCYLLESSRGRIRNYYKSGGGPQLKRSDRVARVALCAHSARIKAKRTSWKDPYFFMVVVIFKSISVR
jgi:hypothetical protein